MRKKRAIRNVFVSLILQFITIICGFIVPKLIIENYGSNVNGLISSITQFLAYITLLQFGIGPVIKAALYKPISQKDKNQIINILGSAEKFFRKIAVIFIIYIIFLCFAYPMFINTEFDIIFTASLILIISISTFCEYYFGITYELYLQAELQSYIVSEIQIITTLLNTLLIVILVLFRSDIHIVKLISAFVYVLKPILQSIYVKRKYNINLSKADSNYKLKNKWDGLAQHVASVIHSNTDTIILTIFASLKEVSVYSVYMLIINGIKSVIGSFTNGIDAMFGNMIANNEKENLSRSFKTYEAIYFSCITLIFTCTIILITPFVNIYTFGITDINYNRPLFGMMIVLAEYVYSIRLPYSTLTLASGHFKQTMIGAWAEAIVNVIISIILVIHYGLVGVAIGTFIAMLIRTFEFIFYASKHILNTSFITEVVRFIILILEMVLSITIYNFLINIEIDSYLDWILAGISISGISLLVILSINFVVYKNDFSDILNVLNIRRREEHE